MHTATTPAASIEYQSSPMIDRSEIRELTKDVSQSPYYNADIAPVGIAGRRWGTFDIAALWISMCACVPTYMLASSMIAQGMNWWQSVGIITLGNVIVLIPMILNAHAGTRYGISFPVYCRASFGIRGANIPAMLRALVACGWFGIQAWIGGDAIYRIVTVFFPGVAHPPIAHLGINLAQLICFLFFWAINMLVVYNGIESIRLLLNIKAPLLIVMGLVLLGWAAWKVHGIGPMLHPLTPENSTDGLTSHPPTVSLALFAASLTAMVGFWATLSLNIPDFSRYARSQKSQMLGQAIGLPTTMALFSFIGVAVTGATITMFKSAIWNPVDLLTKFQNPVVLVIAMFSLCLATLATNIAANVVSPANDFSHLAPRLISFRTGGFITGIIGILIMPWKLLADPTGYIFTWLVGYSSLLGAVGGVMIVDYVLLRRGQLNLAELYESTGRYWYRAGFNPLAIIALLAGIAPCVPGFCGTVQWASVSPFWMSLYPYAWFLSFAVSGAVYAVLSMMLKPAYR